MIFKIIFFNWFKFILLLMFLNFLFLNFPLVLTVYSVYLLFSALASWIADLNQGSQKK